MDPVLLVVIAIVLSLCILGYPYLKKKFFGKDAVENEGRDERAENNGNEGRVMAGAGRRAARQRRNVARQYQDDEEDNEDNQQIPTGKIGTKKMRKLQAKAEKKALREQEEALRADEQKRKEQRDKERKEREDALLTQQKAEEENQLKLKKQKEEKELEEYLALKESFVVEEEGETKTDEDRTLAEFIQYIKKHKVVFLEDLASEFNMRTQSVIDRIQNLQSSGQLSGVTDDRGKFIYISNEELRAVAKYIKQRGRVSISELAQSSNSFITL